MTFIDTLSTMWRDSSALLRLIIINVAMFALIMVGRLVASLCGSGIITELVGWLECPDSMLALVTHPWSLITYMFVHVDIFHLIFNMLLLYWFGSVFMLTGVSRQIYFLYLAGGMAGGLLFAATGSIPTWYNTGLLAGSSASVMAIVVAAVVLHPDYRFNLFIFGEVALKWVGVAVIVLAMIGGGSKAAHLGGAATGVVYAVMLTRGRDLSAFLKCCTISSNKFRYNPGGRTTQASNDKSREEELDEILDKVRRSGYASLSRSEKKRLIDISKK